MSHSAGVVIQVVHIELKVMNVVQALPCAVHESMENFDDFVLGVRFYCFRDVIIRITLTKIADFVEGKNFWIVWPIHEGAERSLVVLNLLK